MLTFRDLSVKAGHLHIRKHQLITALSTDPDALGFEVCHDLPLAFRVYVDDAYHAGLRLSPLNVCCVVNIEGFLDGLTHAATVWIKQYWGKDDDPVRLAFLPGSAAKQHPQPRDVF